MAIVQKFGGSAFTGTVNGDDASAGNVGEYLFAQGSGISLADGVASDVTSLLLQPGDWELWAAVSFAIGASTSITQIQESISLNSATLNAGGTYYASEFFNAVVPGASSSKLWMANIRRRLSFAVPTTFYLVTTARFTVSTLDANGNLNARRMR